MWAAEEPEDIVTALHVLNQQQREQEAAERDN